MCSSSIRILFFSFAIAVCLASCKSSFILENVNFAQPVESVLQPDTENNIHDQRYAVRFSITPILNKEGVQQVENIHLIRDRNGIYYLTAPDFSTVYLFLPEEGTFKLKEEIAIPSGTLSSPAFNQREDHIELLDVTNGVTFKLNSDGIIEEEAS